MFSLEKGELQWDLRAAFQCLQRGSEEGTSLFAEVCGGRTRDNAYCTTGISGYEEKLSP